MGEGRGGPSGGLDYWVRRSPYFAATERHGCRRYSISHHMYLASHFGDAIDEYWHLVNGVTLWDVGAQRQVEISGPDALAFTDMLTCRDISRCPVGRGRYAPVTAEDGGIVNDPVLLRLATDRFWLSASDTDLLLWARGVAVHAGMRVTIAEPDVSPLQVQGPKSKAVMAALLGEWVGSLRYYELKEVELDRIPLVVTRTGWTGELGFEIYLRDDSFGDVLWERVLEAGRPHGLVVTGPSDIQRVEAGILAYGSDITLETNPFELGLDRFVELDTSRDFIGKRALQEIGQRGVTRKLVGIEIEGGRLPRPFDRPWPAASGKEPIGHVTVAVFSPRIGKNIGYAMVAIEHARLGTRFTVNAPWAEAIATVVERPFIDPYTTRS